MSHAFLAAWNPSSPSFFGSDCSREGSEAVVKSLIKAFPADVGGSPEYLLDATITRCSLLLLSKFTWANIVQQIIMM